MESGGFSRAATRLAVSQPTLSQVVRALEEAVGAPLVVRSRVGASGRLPAGRLRCAPRGFLVAVDEAHVAQADRDPRRRLAVAAGQAPAAYVLARAVAELRTRLPAVDAVFVVGDETRVVDAAARRRARRGVS